MHERGSQLEPLQVAGGVFIQAAISELAQAEIAEHFVRPPTSVAAGRPGTLSMGSAASAPRMTRSSAVPGVASPTRVMSCAPRARTASRNATNCTLVTSKRSIENAPSVTVCAGRSSARPRSLPSGYTPLEIGIIENLIERGHAYPAAGGVYFDTQSFPAYGRLSGNTLDRLQSGHRKEIDDPNKKHHADCLLWRPAGLLASSLARSPRPGTAPTAGNPFGIPAGSSALPGVIARRRGGVVGILARHQRRLRVALGVAFLGAAAGSSALALVNGPVGPATYSPALTELRPALGRDSTLVLAPRQMLASEHGRDYLVWELRGGRVCVEDAPASPSPRQAPAGISHVITVGAAQEPPFAGLRLTRRAGAYALWRPQTAPRGHGTCRPIAVGERADPGEAEGGE